MSHRYRIEHQDGIYFLTMTVNKWVDVFTRPLYKSIVLNSLKYCQEHLGLKLHAYVLMSNHIHLVASAKEGYTLSSFINSFKTFVANHIIIQLKTNKESRDWILDILKNNKGGLDFWKKSNHPILLYSDKVIRQKINYIHRNPVKASIVKLAEHYKYSSASYYENGKADLINIEPI